MDDRRFHQRQRAESFHGGCSKARYILPWCGGSPAVWTSCLLFFQVGLLGGYAYAHGLVSFLLERRKIHVGVHFALLALALFLLPITPSPEMKPDASGERWKLKPLRTAAITAAFCVGLSAIRRPESFAAFKDILTP